MKNMKIIIALLLGATGSAALPVPKAAARTARTAAAAAAGEPKKAFALDPKEIFAPAATAFPVKQDDAPQRRLDEVDNPWTLIKSGAVCNSDYAELGLFDTIDGCADMCAHAEGCRFFSYGTGNKAGSCFHDKTSDGTCSEGWVPDSFNSYVRTASPISYNLATKNYILNNFCTASPSGYKCATNTYVLNNECTACPSGSTCDGAEATACDKTKYVLNNVCTDCPPGHTCDGAAATKAEPKDATAAERAECLAGSEGSCDKCCEGIAGVCVTASKDLVKLSDKDDCVLLKEDGNKIDGKGGDDAIVVKGDGNSIKGGDDKDALIVEGNYNGLHGEEGDDTLTVVKGDANLLWGGAGEDTFSRPGGNTQDSGTDGKGNRANQSSTPLIVGLCVGAAVLVLVLAVVVRKLRGRAAEETSAPQLDAEVQVEA